AVPYGTRVVPYGTRVVPYGTRAVPYGTRVVPYGTRAVPYGTRAVPYGTGVVPYGTRVVPCPPQYSSAVEIDSTHTVVPGGTTYSLCLRLTQASGSFTLKRCRTKS
ncbi:MAG: hypothetical protein ACJ76J_07835, partial [Thermoanaerobaculia bacterium]